ncbi:MAG TPA: ABC transporter permease [Candidatus Acidoferrales bacterium]|nr:ABC transporter permease [Candidatus Acidoferrales bacterium]
MIQRSAPRIAAGHNPFETAFWKTRILVTQISAITDAEIQKLKHDPVELFTRVIQPALWLLLFGQVFGRLRGIPTGGIPYESYLVPGILAQSALFIAIFYGISAIWERDLGVLYKYMMSPAPRFALVIGKAISAGIRGLSQAIMVYILATLLGIDLRHDVLALIGVAGIIMVGAAIFSTFSLIVACIVKTRERFMGIGQVLTMPLFFASSAIYPVALMPPWLRVIAAGNPLTYQVDALRALMLPGYHLAFSVQANVAIQAGALVALIAIAAKIYPSILN